MQLNLKIRAAKKEDAHLLWVWANDPDVRELSFNSNYISWKEHINWFEKQLKSENVHFLVLNNNIPLGQVRFDIINNKAIISIIIAKEYRNCGLGSSIICSSVNRFFFISQVNEIIARVKAENIPSIKAFIKSGFDVIGEGNIKGQRAIIFSKKKTL